MKAFGESKDELDEDLATRLKELAKILIITSDLSGFTNWELMSTCGTLYTNYLRNSPHKEMAIRDAKELVKALEYDEKAPNESH